MANSTALKELSRSQLIERFSELVKTERKIMHLVLECIAEIETRRIHLEEAYPSMFEYLVRRYGYSPSAACRRIDAARLLREIPSVAEKIQAGTINLSQIAQLQRATRETEKLEGRQVKATEKEDILNKIENTSQEATERILSKEFSLTIPTVDKTQYHRDDSTTLTVTFTKEQMSALQQARDAVSHSVPDGHWADTLTYLAKMELKRRWGSRWQAG